VSALGIVFGLILLQAAWQATREHRPGETAAPPDPLGERLRLNGSYGDNSVQDYMPSIV